MALVEALPLRHLLVPATAAIISKDAQPRRRSDSKSSSITCFDKSIISLYRRRLRYVRMGLGSRKKRDFNNEQIAKRFAKDIDSSCGQTIAGGAGNITKKTTMKSARGSSDIRCWLECFLYATKKLRSESYFSYDGRCLRCCLLFCKQNQDPRARRQPVQRLTLLSPALARKFSRTRRAREMRPIRFARISCTGNLETRGADRLEARLFRAYLRELTARDAAEEKIAELLCAMKRIYVYPCMY